MGKNLESALANINKKFGQGTIMTLGEQIPVQQNLLSSGSLLIDKALGGGIPIGYKDRGGTGRIVEVFGVESSGKSTLALQFAAECQKEGGTVAYVDVENALDTTYAKKLGVDTDAMIFTQPSSAEQALEIVRMLADSGEVNLVIVDSVAALAPQAELDGEMGDVTIGQLARLMSKSLRVLAGLLNEKTCSVIFINQLREKINTGFSMGDPTTTSGGRALKYYASQRIELRKTTAIKNGDQVIGNNVKVKIVKNKIAPPMKVVEVPMIFGEGFARGDDEILELAFDYELIQKAGSWYATHDGQRFQGKSAVKEYYKANPELIAYLKENVIRLIKGEEIPQEFSINPKTGEVIM